MVGNWIVQITPHRLWFSAAAERFASDVRRSASPVRYAVGFLAALCAVLSRVFLVPYWGGVPLITFYPAVFVAAVLGGFAAGAFATLGLSLAAAYLFIEPVHSFRIANAGELVALLLFVSLGCFISLLVELLVRARETAQQARTQAIEAMVEAESANTAKDKFLAMLSHELRTPLQAILSGVQVLKSKFHLPSEMDSMINLIERNAKTEARLVRDLLEFTKCSAGKMTLNCERATLRPIIESVLEGMRPLFDEKRLTVCFTHTGTEVAVWIDPQRIEEILINLLGNAAKFTAPGGWIEVNLNERDSARIVLSVMDSGIGFEEELKKRLFTPFTQGDTAQRNAGLGLGLAIVKNFVELHGGTIQGFSEGKGKGSRFVVRLPKIPIEVRMQSAAQAGS